LYLGVFSFAFLFIFKISKEKKSLQLFNFNSVDIAFLIYILLFTLTKIVNSGIEEGLNTFFRSCQDYFIFIWIRFFISSQEDNENKVFKVLYLATIISMTYGLLQFFHLDIFHRQSDIHRLSGFHKNPYTYGGQLIILFFFLINDFRTRNKLISLVLSALCFFCILNTSERAVLLGVVIGSVFYYFINKSNKKQLNYVFALVSVPIVLTAIFNRKAVNRIKNIIFPSEAVKTNIRLKLWGIAIAVWKKNILFGAGKFPTVYHQSGNGFSFKILKHAHNVYLQLLVTNGLLGLMAYLGLLFSIIQKLYLSLSRNKYASCSIAVILAFMIEGCFEYFWGDSEVRYLLIYFIGFVFGILAKCELKQESVK